MRVAFIVLSLLISNVSFADKSQKIDITRLSNNVYQHTSYMNIKPWGSVGASGLIVVDNNDAYIIDTPWTDEGTQQVIEWIKLKNLNLKGALVTHFHQDASGGIEQLNNANIKTYATTLTNTLLKAHNRATSHHEITSNELSLVNDVIEVFYPGPGHSEDNIVVWLSKEKILFGGCFVKNIHSKGLGNIEDASIMEWPTSLQRVIDKYPQVNVVVPGHGAIGDIDLLKHTQALAIEQSH